MRQIVSPLPARPRGGHLCPGGFGERSSDGLGGLDWEVLNGVIDDALRLLGREGAPHHLELLIDEVSHDLRHVLPPAPLEEFLLGGISIAESDRKSQPVQLRQIAENRPGADLQAASQVDHPDAGSGG